MIHTTTYASPLGLLTLAAHEGALCGLWLPGQKYYGAGLPDDAREAGDLPVFAAAKQWLSCYFEGESPGLEGLRLGPMGSPFRQRVWRQLLEIPYGQTLTYGALGRQAAAQIGRESMSAQAVGGAVGHNPISIIIPCHRVVGAAGSLTGYAGGIAAKQFLLGLEGADVSGFTVPKKGTAL